MPALFTICGVWSRRLLQVIVTLFPDAQEPDETVGQRFEIGSGLTLGLRAELSHLRNARCRC